MSTLSGFASKGEKGKSKFQSLDINNIYRGESFESHQQRSTLPRKHGMQSLGKLPSARRPPANLPSLKSEHSGNDPAVSLVPTGGTGWGSKPGESGSSATSANQSTIPNTSTTTVPAVTVPASANITSSINSPQVPGGSNAIPGVTISGNNTTVPAAPTDQQPPMPQPHVDKSWSSIIGPGDPNVHPPSFLAHQSPQFQHEFPKLLGGDGQAPATGPKGGSETPYGPGPSLRPQTEGSWTQGGGVRGGLGLNNPAAPGHQAVGPDSAGGRSTSGPCAVPGGPPGSAGHEPSNQFRSVMTPFLFRPNYPGGGFPSNFQGPMHGPPRPRYPYPTDNRFMSPRPNLSGTDDEIIAPRPIIKEEELNKMEDLSRDTGWASHDDIDYNQKLEFSDDEAAEDDRSKSSTHPPSTQQQIQPTSTSPPIQQQQQQQQPSQQPTQQQQQQQQQQQTQPSASNQPPRKDPPRGWNAPAPPPPSAITNSVPPLGGPRTSAPLSAGAGPGPAINSGPTMITNPQQEDEFWRERRRQHNEDVALVVERAKRRKEEEEKRFELSRMNAQKKLHLLEEKMKIKNDEKQQQLQQQQQQPIQPQVQQQNQQSQQQQQQQQLLISTSQIDQPSNGLEWEKEDRIIEHDRDRSRHSSEGTEDPVQVPVSHQPPIQSQIPPSRPRDIPRVSEQNVVSQSSKQQTTSSSREIPRDRPERDREQLPFSKIFQQDIPPRFKKNFQRANVTDPRWAPTVATSIGSRRQDVDEYRSTRYPNEFREKYRDEKEDHDHERKDMEPWCSESTFLDEKEKKKSSEPPLRHPPGPPITREKLEAAERGNGGSSNSLDKSRNQLTTLISKSSNPLLQLSQPLIDLDNKQDNMMQFMNSGPITPTPAQAPSIIQASPVSTLPTSIISWSDDTTIKQDPVDLHQQQQPQQTISIPTHIENLDKNYDKESQPKLEIKQETLELDKKSSDHVDLLITNENKRNNESKSRRSGRSNWNTRSWGSSGGGGGGGVGGGGGGSRRRGGRPDSGHSCDDESTNEEEPTLNQANRDREHGGNHRRRDVRRSQRSPKQGGGKKEKEERNREARRTSDSEKSGITKRIGGSLSGNACGTTGTGQNLSTSGNACSSGSSVPPPSGNSREGFAPRGEPSRCGRGGFNRNRGSLPKRIEGYGPPPAKSPFGQPSCNDTKSESSKTEDNYSLDDKVKMKQQALSASIVGMGIRNPAPPPRLQRKMDGGKSRGVRNPTNSKNKGTGEDENWETTSETSDMGDQHKDSMNSGGRNTSRKSQQPLGSGGGRQGKVSNRGGIGGNTGDSHSKKDKLTNTGLIDGIDLSLSNVVVVDDRPAPEEPLPFDADIGFQQVRSKKNNKEASRKNEDSSKRPSSKDGGRGKTGGKLTSGPSTANPCSASSSAPLVSSQTPTQHSISTKSYDSRPRGKLAPRFARVKEIRKSQQQHNSDEVAQMNKLNESISLFQLKDGPMNAWDKPMPSNSSNSVVQSPIVTQPGTSLQLGNVLGPNTSNPTESCGGLDVNDQGHSADSSQRSTPNGDNRAIGKISREVNEKAVLDGTTAPVKTIIFENTNYKTPGTHGGNKVGGGKVDSASSSGVPSSLTPDPIGSLSNTFPKNSTVEDNADMKLDFSFDTDAMPSSQSSTISPSTAELNLKIASVKRVWESVSPMPTVMEHGPAEDAATAAAVASFPAHGLTSNDDSTVVGDVGYSSGPSMVTNYNGSAVQSISKDSIAASTGVCKVKAQPQQSAVMAAAGSSSIGLPLSPPPYSGAANQQQCYQTAQYSSLTSLSAIPSPPTANFNSTGPLPCQTGTTSIYNVFLDRNQFNQYPQYNMPQGLGQLSQQSIYHAAPPPPSGAGATPDMYAPTSISQYRLQPQQPQGPFGGASPSAVLISSTSNSIVKQPPPTQQQIGAIGTKGAGQATGPYQQNTLPPSAPQHSQLFLPYAEQYLSGSQMVQRGPHAPVPPTLQHPSSTSYYSPAASAGQTGPYYPTGSSGLQPPPQPPPPSHAGAGGSPYPYGGSSASAFGSQKADAWFQMSQQYRGPQTFLKNDTHAAVAHRNQLKSPSTAVAAAAVAAAAAAVAAGQAQHELQLTSVFSQGSQIASPKTRNTKQPSQTQQPSPTQQPHKFNHYQNIAQSNQLGFQQAVRGSMNIGNRASGSGTGGSNAGGGGCSSGGGSVNYPKPIQRPVNFQAGNILNSSGRSGANNNNNNSGGGSHRGNMGHKPQSYYGTCHGGSSLKLDEKTEGKIQVSESLTNTGSTNATGSGNNSTPNPGISTGNNGNGNNNATSATTSPTGGSTSGNNSQTSSNTEPTGSNNAPSDDHGATTDEIKPE